LTDPLPQQARVHDYPADGCRAVRLGVVDAGKSEGKRMGFACGG